MKKRHGVKRALEPLAREHLQQLPTGALLARLARLRWCEESRGGSDLTDEELQSVGDKILFKNSDLWREAYRDLKSILETREHVKRKPS